MIIKDFHRVLDRRCHLKFVTEDETSSILKGKDIISIGRIKMQGEKGILILNIPRNGNDFLKTENNLKEHDLFYSSSEDVTNSALYTLHKKLISSNSVVIDAIININGVTNLFFRFHSIHMKIVSGLIAEASTKLKDFKVNYLGEAEGILDMFRRVAEITNVDYIEANSEIPPEAVDIRKDPIVQILGMGWNRQIRYATDGEISAVFRDRHGLLKVGDPSINEISAAEHIFETKFRNEVVEYISSSAAEMGIPILALPQKLDGRIFTMGFIVPEVSSTEFYSLLFKTFEKFPRWKMYLSFADKVDKPQ